MKTSVHSKFSTNTENKDTKVAVLAWARYGIKLMNQTYAPLNNEKLFSVHKQSNKKWGNLARFGVIIT